LVWVSSSTAATGPRRFEPVKQSDSQRIDSNNGLTIISSSGKQASVGAAIRASSDKQAWLLVSVKNLGKDPIDFGVANLAVLSGDKPLPIDLTEGSGNRVRDCAAARTTLYTTCMASANITDNLSKHGSTSNCLASTSSSYSNCLASDPAAPAVVSKVAPSQVYPSQYQVELPKRGRKDGPATLVVVIMVKDEAQSFVFKEAD
jgi:hypothetical protein